MEIERLVFPSGNPGGRPDCSGSSHLPTSGPTKDDKNKSGFTGDNISEMTETHLPFRVLRPRDRQRGTQLAQPNSVR